MVFEKILKVFNLKNKEKKYRRKLDVIIAPRERDPYYVKIKDARQTSLIFPTLIPSVRVRFSYKKIRIERGKKSFQQLEFFQLLLFVVETNVSSLYKFFDNLRNWLKRLRMRKNPKKERKKITESFGGGKR